MDGQEDKWEHESKIEQSVEWDGERDFGGSLEELYADDCHLVWSAGEYGNTRRVVGMLLWNRFHIISLFVMVTVQPWVLHRIMNAKLCLNS